MEAGKDLLRKIILCGLFSVGSVECMEVFHLVQNGQTALVDTLVGKPTFDPNVKNPQGDAFIFILVEKGYTSLASKIIAKPAFDPNVQNSKGEYLTSVLSNKGMTILLKSVIDHKNFGVTVESQKNQIDYQVVYKKGFEEGHKKGLENAFRDSKAILMSAVQEIEEKIKKIQ